MPCRGPQPNRWRSGPDPVAHAQYRCWIQAKNQANFRGESWTITFEDYQSLWREHWVHKGRTRNDYCMTRTDDEGAWSLGNVEVLPRYEHFSRSGKKRNLARWGRR